EPPPPVPPVAQRDLDARLERIRKAHSYPVQGRMDAAISSGMLGSAEQLARDLRPRAHGMRWWVGPLGVCIVGGLVALGMGLRGVRRSPSLPGRDDMSGLGSARPALLPSSLRSNGSEKIAGVLSRVHGYGGAESPELSALLNEEAGMFGKALEEGCAPGSAGCALLARAKQVFAPALTPAPVHRGAAPLGSWLRGLRLPEIGLRDDPRVRELVAFHTENPSGREQFQALLFQCGAYEQLFHRNLLTRSLPTDLIAVVMVESGCVPDAESALGARGLWQFMPATARAYHLRVQSGILDERLSPTKSTEAALGFLGDLYRKLHSWELSLAAYRLGPFGLLAQLGQGDALDYWDLANAGLLPSETAGYVPKVQAFALILANLEHFRFETAQQHGLEHTATLSVPAGTRLGLVARAAGSSGSRIRELNPDIIADTVPGLVGERFSVRVPNDTTSHAHESLTRLIASGDHTDECVPLSFDWGRQHFTKTMASRCAEAASIAVSPPRSGRGGSSRVGSGTRGRGSLR
ncbi:MAG TPA: lytic transglycosylase domain-containing protein, partial [Polyangiaceae bacterium]|nr:lytic transglycosylase domain-containing protein [Polyangiaceae bacterium]